MNPFNKYILILCSFLFFIGNVKAQNKKIDSLKNELKIHTEKDAERVDLLYKIAFSSFQRDTELTLVYLGEAEALSNDINYIKGKAKVAYLKGILENRKSKYETSLNFFKRSLAHYESIKDKDGMAVVYNAFGITHFDMAQYDEALHDYKRASEIFEAIGNEEELITGLINIGNVYLVLGKYNEAISNYNKALQQSEKIDDKGAIANLHSSLGVVYRNQGNYPLAIEYYNKSLYYDKQTQDTLGIAVKLNNLGETYTSIQKYSSALKYHQQSLKYALQIGSKSLAATNNNNIGNIYMEKKEYKKALKHYNQSLEINQKINRIEQAALCFHNIGEVNFLLGKPIVARENFIKAKNINDKIGSKRELSYDLLGIAQTYLHEEQHKNALSYALKGKDIAKELNLLEVQKKASKILSNIYETLGDYKKAYKNHQQYKILNDSIFNKENIERITQLEYEYKYKQALDSASIRELKLTKTVLTTSKDLEKSKRNYLWAIIGFLSVSLLSGSIIFYQKLRNAKAVTQNVMIEQKLLRSQMTPHFIFNSLSVLQGMILNKEEKKSVSYVSKFSKLLRIILENSRDKTVPLSQELTAIENYLALQNLENASYTYTIHVDDTVDTSMYKIPPMLIQPFVENAIEHAFVNQKDNRTIDIRLSYTQNILICTIIDNGIGVDSLKKNNNQEKKSLSTTITTERLKMLSKDFKMKGSVTVVDRKKFNEQGTIVTLSIPYKIIQNRH